MTYEAIIEALPALTEDDLRALNHAIVARIRLGRSQQAVTSIASLRAGDRVVLSGLRGDYNGRYGTIVRLIQTRCEVRVDGMVATVRIPAVCLTKVDADAAA